MKTIVRKEGRVWQLQKAKAQFSEVVNCALADEPQLVTRNGHPSVYVVAAETYQAEHARDGLNKKDILLSSPSRDIELETPRNKSDGREVAL